LDEAPDPEFELKADELSDAGEIPGPIYLYLGQEAVAVGACLALARTTSSRAPIAVTDMSSPRAPIPSG
jgi:hypothetical protein